MFGCRAFVHIPKDERSKLDSKTKECIFLGFGCEEFGYKLWDHIKKKIVRNIDVVFFKDETTADIGKPEKPLSSKEHPLNLDPVPLPMVHDDQGGEEQVDIGDTTVDDNLEIDDAEQE